MTLRRNQGSTGVKPDMRHAGDERIVQEARIGRRIGDDQDLARLKDSVGTEGNFATGIAASSA